MKKKIYAAPIAEHILFAPAEAVTNSSNWKWDSIWEWNKWNSQNITASIQGTNPLWEGYETLGNETENRDKPY